MPHLYRDETIPVFEQLKMEQGLALDSRKWLYEKLEKQLGRPVVSFFTSFYPSVGIEEGDDKIFEDLIKHIDLSKGLVLCINSLGGSGTAATRIIRACRKFSGTGDFWALVPGKAKSAASLICMGSSKIFMGPLSELGPIDPQVPITIGPNRDDYDMVSIQDILDSYDELLKKSEKVRGNLNPYLQQLSKYDESVLRKLKRLRDYSNSYAISTLSSGMMSGKKGIDKKISIFLDPNVAKVHGMPIFLEDAEKCGLKIEELKTSSEIYCDSFELCMRLENLLSTGFAKCIESKHFNSLIPYKDWSI